MKSNMEEKRNVTICFSSDEMHIYRYFKSKGKASTEMKRVLRDYVENNQVESDSSEVVDERVAKILSAILGNGATISSINIPNIENEVSTPPKNDLNSVNNEDTVKDEKSPEDEFDLPPTDILGGFM